MVWEVPADVVEITTRLHADARPEEEDRAAFVNALVNHLEGAASQAQGGALMSTHAKGTANESGSSKSNVGSSSKKRKVPQGGLASAFGLQARRKFSYVEDVSTWKVRSPYFLQMVKAIGQAGPSHVPPSYHALRTIELNEEMDELACSTIMQTLGGNAYFNVAKETIAYGVWQNLCELYEKKSNASQVYWLKKLVELKMKKGTPISNHLNEFHTIFS
ncbi:hypothetical protein L7F22_017203 [Adiantum nelumboides]|nr:hypothetical protein [Adiantum nelumboides]